MGKVHYNVLLQSYFGYVKMELLIRSISSCSSSCSSSSSSIVIYINHLCTTAITDTTILIFRNNGTNNGNNSMYSYIINNTKVFILHAHYDISVFICLFHQLRRFDDIEAEGLLDALDEEIRQRSMSSNELECHKACRSSLAFAIHVSHNSLTTSHHCTIVVRIMFCFCAIFCAISMTFLPLIVV